ncbi:MAG: TlpA family protein disulfide reductase [Deltaproteobacteria bacterium]|nr:TlpA family protein disulfide reductase [Deltaproteobacteria bacterium]
MNENGAPTSKRLTAMMIVLIIVGCATPTPHVPAPPATASNAPSTTIVLPPLTDPVQRDYLGVKTTEPFALNDIQTRVLIIEVFDFYCPHCQREAPNVNRLYHSIASDPNLKDRIKLIGIGVRNTAFEVNQFRKSFTVPFPLFPDRSRDIARQLEIRQTPTFVGFVLEPDGRLRRFMHAPGGMGNVDEFLARVIQLSGLEKPQP